MAANDPGNLMAAEIREAPDAVARQAESLRAPLAELVRHLRRHRPQVVVTCARGSSAHAATFGKHLIERTLGIPVAAAAPSIATVYRRSLTLSGQLFLAVSQSGRSDDLVELAASAKAAGAVTAALVNAADSPLAAACDIVLPISAGPELSVAATKTVIASMSALLRLVALWAEDTDATAALERLPERLAAATALDWSPALPSLATAESLVTIGRGPTLSIAREAALKLKETSNLHAEAFSGAEFLHGPVSLVSSRYPILMLMPNDEAAPGLRQLADDLRGKGAALFVAGPDEAAGRAAGARAGSAGGGRDLPPAELLRHGAAACGLARDRRRPAASPEQGDPHPMTALAKAVQADHLFDGETVRHDHAVVIEDGCIASVLPRRPPAAGVPGGTASGGRLARPRFHRRPGQRRRRCAVQRRSLTEDGRRDRGGASAVRNDRPVADADHRRAGEDAGRDCGGPGGHEDEPGRARDPSRGPVHLRGTARRASRRRDPRADRGRRGAADEFSRQGRPS